VFVHPTTYTRASGPCLSRRYLISSLIQNSATRAGPVPSFRGKGRIRSVIAVMSFASALREKRDPGVDFYRKMGIEVAGCQGCSKEARSVVSHRRVSYVLRCSGMSHLTQQGRSDRDAEPTPLSDHPPIVSMAPPSSRGHAAKGACPPHESFRPLWPFR